MGNETAIKAEGLCKTYRLYDKPVNRLKESIHPFRKKYHRDYYALKDVSFEIEKGHTVGIIGKNGSGKSTLLKIITGVLTPTGGTVEVNGRISALLELGAGFNPELSGIENIFFSGTIMGYAREEVEAKMDEILAFADIGDFVNQPVKTYSSGMFVRLAFAMSINVEPVVLIVDEALSVGDIRFQQKCFRKIRSLRESGKTILFVSHDMGSVRSFCDSVVWLKDGMIFKEGDPAEITREYLSFMTYGMESVENEKPKNNEEREAPKEGAAEAISLEREIEWEDLGGCSSFGEGGAEISKVALYSKEPFRKIKLYDGGGWVELFVEIKPTRTVYSPIVGFNMYNEYGHCILGINNCIIGLDLKPLEEGKPVVIKFEFKMPILKNGNYTFTIAVAEGTLYTHVQLHWIHDAYILQISSENLQSKFGHYFALPEQEAKMQIIQAQK